MVFSTDIIQKRENINNTPTKSNTNSIKIYENTSLFVDTLQYIIQEDILLSNELAKYNIQTYREKKRESLNEDNLITNMIRNRNFGFGSSNNEPKPSFIKTGISNFYQKVKTNFTIESIIEMIINGFIELIKRVWRSFEVLCMNLIATKDSQIRRKASSINDIGVDMVYNKPMFIYTNITDCTGRASLEEDLTKIFMDLKDFITSFSAIKSPRDLEIAIKDFANSTKNDEFEYDDIRARLLGSNSPITAEEYNEALFRYFRNGSSTAITNYTITPAEMRKRLESWQKAPRMIKAYQRDRDILEKSGKNLEAKVKSFQADKYIREVPSNTIELYSNMISNVANRIKTTCNIFLLYYTQRLDAAKDELRLNREILFRAAEYCVKEGI